MKLAADAMVGRLAKWLRLMGFDTVYLPKGPVRFDRTRFLLTRRIPGPHGKRLLGWKSVIRLESEETGKQVIETINALGIRKVDLRPMTRCNVCNGVLVHSNHEEAADLVPPYVLNTQTHFRRCPDCGRFYWPATHHKRILNTIEQYFETKKEPFGETMGFSAAADGDN